MKISKSINKITAEILIDIGCVNFDIKKQFKLTSGRLSPIYCDCRKIISYAKERELLMDFAIKLIKKQTYYKKIELIAGGETAGIPFAAILANKLNLPMIYIRKKQKAFGKKKQIEGDFINNANVLLVEDLLTDGGSKKEFFEALRIENLNLISTFVVFNYGIFENEIKFKDNSSKLIFLTNWNNILSVAKSRKILVSNEIKYIEEFLKSFGVKN